jgi:hypothetical protein
MKNDLEQHRRVTSVCRNIVLGGGAKETAVVS